ncbi:hypothetical protein MOTT16_07340 [Moraxella osloensis]|uniref:Uncharacterized protein n=1 Tax=Faucicola osloensis TaxID=34062 RepID=A0AAD0AI87_FAUOS|nr:hypothetical protein [Moraxella osloensis]ATQ83655.1 hypothetical protein YHS_07355 [Moraxella osloensis]ATW86148.1 hypothetical protein MOTT16_07340 [Moraxella osloensis]
MLSKNLSTPCNIIDHISLYHFWANTLPSVLPIVADGSHISICHLKKVLPELLKVVLYQLSAKIQQNPSLTHRTLPQVTDKNSFIPEFFTALVTKNLTEKGINFVTLKQLSKSSPSIFEQLFDDETQKTMIAGVLLEKTHLPLDNLLTIWQTITALAVINLADMISSLQNNIDSAQITEWLVMQPVFFMSPQDTGLMNALGFRRAVSFQAMQQQQLKWSKIQNVADLPVYQQHIIQQMAIYKAANFFNIAPITIPHAHFNQHVISTGNRQINKTVTSNTQTALSASNIFAKPQIRKPAHWIDKLQKNWIATATVLSVAVFGGIGALVSVKDKPAATQPSAKMSVAHPVYHDVAIVKVASTPSTVTNEMTTAEHHKKHDKSKSLDEKPSVQSEKARAMKKSDKQEESKKAESKKDRKKNIDNDAKADGKNEAKQNHKKKASSSKVDSGQSEKTSSTTKKSTTKDKAVKEKSPKEKDKSSSSTTATDRKSAKKPDKKANNTMDNKADDKANNKVGNKVNNEANNKPRSKSITH